MDYDSALERITDFIEKKEGDQHLRSLLELTLELCCKGGKQVEHRNGH